MGNGKTAWHHVDACIKYFPLLRQCGHTGICVQHYSWDRAVFGPAARLVEGYHALQYEAMRADEPEGTADLLEQMDWYVSTGCASHDCQHALEWGMAELIPDTDMSSLTTDLWAVIESLRNSYDQLHRHLAHFVHSKLSISDAPTDRQEHYAYWIALGVESEVAYHLDD